MTLCDSFSSVFKLPLADIPPPPPEIPILDATLPHPIVIAVAGLCLSFAVIAFGVRRKRGMPRSLSKTTLVTGVALAIVTGGIAAWAASQWREYRIARENWVPNGPVEDWTDDTPDPSDDSPDVVDEPGSEDPLDQDVVIDGSDESPE